MGPLSSTLPALTEDELAPGQYLHPNLPLWGVWADGRQVIYKTCSIRGVSVYLTGTTIGGTSIYTVEEVDWASGKASLLTDTSFTTTDASTVTEYIDEVLERYLEPSKLSEMMLEIM